MWLGKGRALGRGQAGGSPKPCWGLPCSARGRSAPSSRGTGVQTPSAWCQNCCACGAVVLDPLRCGAVLQAALHAQQGRTALMRVAESSDQVHECHKRFWQPGTEESPRGQRLLSSGAFAGDGAGRPSYAMLLSPRGACCQHFPSDRPPAVSGKPSCFGAGRVAGLGTGAGAGLHGHPGAMPAAPLMEQEEQTGTGATAERRVLGSARERLEKHRVRAWTLLGVGCPGPGKGRGQQCQQLGVLCPPQGANQAPTLSKMPRFAAGPQMGISLGATGNLAKNPTEHKNRKALFKETGSRARNTECAQVSLLPGETLAQCLHDPAPFGTNNLLSQVKINQDKGSLQPQTHSWHITVLRAQELCCLHRAGDTSSPWLLSNSAARGPAQSAHARCQRSPADSPALGAKGTNNCREAVDIPQVLHECLRPGISLEQMAAALLFLGTGISLEQMEAALLKEPHLETQLLHPLIYEGSGSLVLGSSKCGVCPAGPMRYECWSWGKIAARAGNEKINLSARKAFCSFTMQLKCDGKRHRLAVTATFPTSIKLPGAALSGRDCQAYCISLQVQRGEQRQTQGSPCRARVPGSSSGVSAVLRRGGQQPLAAGTRFQGQTRPRYRNPSQGPCCLPSALRHRAPGTGSSWDAPAGVPCRAVPRLLQMLALSGTDCKANSALKETLVLPRLRGPQFALGVAARMSARHSAQLPAAPKQSPHSSPRVPQASRGGSEQAVPCPAAPRSPRGSPGLLKAKGGRGGSSSFVLPMARGQDLGPIPEEQTATAVAKEVARRLFQGLQTAAEKKAEMSHIAMAQDSRASRLAVGSLGTGSLRRGEWGKVGTRKGEGNSSEPTTDTPQGQDQEHTVTAVAKEVARRLFQGLQTAAEKKAEMSHIAMAQDSRASRGRVQSLHQHHQCRLRCGKGRERLGEGALLSPAAAALLQGRVPRDSQPSPLEMLARRHFPAHCNGPASVREPCLPASPEAEALTFAVVVSCTVTSEDPCRLPPCSCASLSSSKPWPHRVWEERRLGLLPVPAARGFLQQVALWADGPAKAAAVGVPFPWAGEAQSWAALKPQKEMAQIIFCEATKGDGNAVGCGGALEEQTAAPPFLVPQGGALRDASTKRCLQHLRPSLQGERVYKKLPCVDELAEIAVRSHLRAVVCPAVLPVASQGAGAHPAPRQSILMGSTQGSAQPRPQTSPQHFQLSPLLRAACPRATSSPCTRVSAPPATIAAGPVAMAPPGCWMEEGEARIRTQSTLSGTTQPPPDGPWQQFLDSPMLAASSTKLQVELALAAWAQLCPPSPASPLGALGQRCLICASREP
ncbi:hypothetical protein Anapl_10202 [Anas platyrhynchos]|uniref:Uncharacterized protein n=1 Tax=Anas platyrhynchos TaxID=8839 RepID=R0M867_ANAPL|nr:hypothetical protein Anapl_10202 [Anas platyrhynchos]